MSDEELIANDLYVAVVQPETIWWDDLTPEMQEGWRRGARRVMADPERLGRALHEVYCHHNYRMHSDPTGHHSAEAVLTAYRHGTIS